MMSYWPLLPDYLQTYIINIKEKREAHLQEIRDTASSFKRVIPIKYSGIGYVLNVHVVEKIFFKRIKHQCGLCGAMTSSNSYDLQRGCNYNKPDLCHKCSQACNPISEFTFVYGNARHDVHNAQYTHITELSRFFVAAGISPTLTWYARPIKKEEKPVLKKSRHQHQYKQPQKYKPCKNPKYKKGFR